MLLEGKDPERRIGTAIMLRVMPGGKFDLSSRSFYEEENEGTAEGASLEALANALLTTLAGGTVSDIKPVTEFPEHVQILQGAFGEGSSFAST